jgi:hypothetical protein
MITKAEIKFIEYLKGWSGSFYTNLFDLIFSADADNFRKIGEAFPDECEVIKKYQNERGYFADIQERYANRSESEKSPPGH